MSEQSSTQARAAKRYSRDMILASLLYTAVVVGGVLAIKQDLPHWAVVVIALLPILPALLMLRAYLVFLKSMDEFHRQMQGEAVAIAAGLTGFGSFTYGFLEEWAGFPHLPLIWVLPVLIFSWGVALCIVRLRYK